MLSRGGGGGGGGGGCCHQRLFADHLPILKVLQGDNEVIPFVNSVHADEFFDST